MQNSWEEWRERNPGDCSGVHKRQMHCPPAGRPLAQDDTLACLSRLGELAPLLLAGAEGERHGPAYACHNTNKVGSHSDRNLSIEVRASCASCPGGDRCPVRSQHAPPPPPTARGTPGNPNPGYYRTPRTTPPGGRLFWLRPGLQHPSAAPHAPGGPAIGVQLICDTDREMAKSRGLPLAKRVLAGWGLRPACVIPEGRRLQARKVITLAWSA